MYKRLIFPILAFLILFDIWLYIVYFKSPQPTVQTTKNSQSRKEFVSVDPRYQIKPGEIKLVSPGNLDELSLPIIAFVGTISRDPIANQKSQTVQVRISFLTNKGKEISANIILGDKWTVAVLRAKGGVMVARQVWSFESISKLIPLLKRGNPIIVELFTEEAPASFFTDSRCNTKCREFSHQQNNNFNNITFFIKSLKGEIEPVSGLAISPLAGLVVYED